MDPRDLELRDLPYSIDGTKLPKELLNATIDIAAWSRQRQKFQKHLKDLHWLADWVRPLVGTFGTAFIALGLPVWALLWLGDKQGILESWQLGLPIVTIFAVSMGMIAALRFTPESEFDRDAKEVVGTFLGGCSLVVAAFLCYAPFPVTAAILGVAMAFFAKIVVPQPSYTTLQLEDEAHIAEKLKDARIPMINLLMSAIKGLNARARFYKRSETRGRHHPELVENIDTQRADLVQFRQEIVVEIAYLLDSLAQEPLGTVFEDVNVGMHLERVQFIGERIRTFHSQEEARNAANRELARLREIP